MFGRLLLLFLVVPVVDLALLVHIGDRLGFWPTVGVVVLTAVVGSWLARREGTAAWRRVQQSLATGGMPGREVIDGLIILVAGAFLLTPGFLTDLVGLLGLLPPSRALIREGLKARFARAVSSGSLRVSARGFGTSPFGPGASGRPTAASPPSGTTRPSAREEAEIEDAVVIEEATDADGR